jgi:HEAT repeat protein
MSLSLDERQTIWETFCHTLKSDTNPAVRAKAAEALGKLGDERFAPILLAALADESTIVRHTIIQSLGKIGSITTIPALIATLKEDENPEISAAAAIALGDIHAEAAIPALLRVLTPSTGMLGTAVYSTVHSVTAAYHFVGLRDLGSMVLASFFGAIGAIGAIAASTASTAHHDIHHSSVSYRTAHDPIVRSSSAQALGKIGSPIAVPTLLIALNSDTDSTVINSIVDALAAIAINDPTSIPQIQTTAKNIITKSTNSQLRQSAVILLGKIALADSIPDLIELLKDPDPNVVQAAIEALGNAAA